MDEANEKKRVVYAVRQRRKRCLECGEKMTDYRSNKRFCSKKCKDKYHNEEKSQTRRFRKMVDDNLKANYEILDELIKQNISSISLDSVISRGFNLSFITSFVKTRTCTYYVCFDISFRVSDTRIFCITRISMTYRD